MMQNRKQPQPEVAAFPQLSTIELCDCLLALGIQVQLEDVAKPVAQTTQMIYARLIENMMGMPLDEMETPKNALMGMMEYRDMYSEALNFTMFFRHCRTLAQLCGVNEFNMTDLTRPDANRLRKILSGIMNFAKFREGRTASYTALQNRVASQIEQTENLRHELARIENSIEEITAKHAEDLPKTEEAKAKNEELRTEMLGLRSTQQHMSQEVEELKQKRQSAVDQAAANNHDLISLQSEITSTRSRLVRSPDRIKREIAEMGFNVAHEKLEIGKYQEKARGLTSRLEVISQLERDISALVEILKEAEVTRMNLEKKKIIKAKEEEKVEQKHVRIGGHQDRLQQLNRQIASISERSQVQNKQLEDTRTRTKERMEALEKEYVIKVKERSMFQRDRDKVEAEKAALETEMGEFTTLHEGEIKKLLEEYRIVRKQAEDYMHTMNDKLGLRL